MQQDEDIETGGDLLEKACVYITEGRYPEDALQTTREPFGVLEDIGTSERAIHSEGCSEGLPGVGKQCWHD